MDWLWLLLLMVLPAVGYLALVTAMDRWGRKHDPMGGTSDDILPIGRGPAIGLPSRLGLRRSVELALQADAVTVGAYCRG